MFNLFIWISSAVHITILIITIYALVRFIRSFLLLDDLDVWKISLHWFSRLRSTAGKFKKQKQVFFKKGVFRNFEKFTGKHLCQSLFFNKVVGLNPVTLLKKRLWNRCFLVYFARFLKTPFLKEHLRWLLLKKIFRIVSRFSCSFQ